MDFSNLRDLLSSRRACDRKRGLRIVWAAIDTPNRRLIKLLLPGMDETVVEQRRDAQRLIKERVAAAIDELADEEDPILFASQLSFLLVVALHLPEAKPAHPRAPLHFQGDE